MYKTVAHYLGLYSSVVISMKVADTAVCRQSEILYLLRNLKGGVEKPLKAK